MLTQKELMVVWMKGREKVLDKFNNDIGKRLLVPIFIKWFGPTTILI